jgi:hypothetical protein
VGQAPTVERRGMRMVEGDYLARRATEELAAAIKASDNRVRERHLELADAYAFRLREWKAIERRSEMRLVAEAATDA